MSANRFGNILQMTTFGESHGLAVGVLIDGCPAGVEWQQDLLLQALGRRRPGQNAVVSARSELDQPEILSGVLGGKTLGTPIAVLIRNLDTRSEDYDKIKTEPRPGHADDVWQNKFGHVDFRGGGRASGRETVTRVVAGAVAQMLMRQLSPHTQVNAFTRQIGEIRVEDNDIDSDLLPQLKLDTTLVRMPNAKKAEAARELLTRARELGHSYGGIAEVQVHGVPPSLGQPVFHKIKSDLAMAVMSLGATTGFELGDGFASVSQEGSAFHAPTSDQTQYGGIRGGITTGEPIHFRVAFKPTSSVLDVAKKGRHDPCIVPRALPVLEAMTWLVLADHILWSRLDRIT